MKMHNIKTYSAILVNMPESEIHHHLIMVYFVSREPDPERQTICESVLSQRYGREKFDNFLARAAADRDEITRQRKRLYGGLVQEVKHVK